MTEQITGQPCDEATRRLEFEKRMGFVGMPPIADLFRPYDPVAEERKKLENETRRIVTRRFSYLQPELLATVVGDLDRVFTSAQHPNGAKIIKSFLLVDASNNWIASLRRQKIKNEEFDDLLIEEPVESMLEIMAASPERFRTQLGLVLSQRSLNEYPSGFRESINPLQTETDLSLEPAHANWFLCDEVEKILEDSINDNAVMSIGERNNPLFLFNNRVKMQGLCLRTFATHEGKVFLSGNMYCPTDPQTRQTLDDAFIAGRGRLSLQEGSWAFMRPLKPKKGTSVDEYIKDALTIARQTPDYYSNTSIIIAGKPHSRTDYRCIGKEDYL